MACLRALAAQRQRYGGAFGEVLDAHAQRQRQRACVKGVVAPMPGGQGEREAHGHALGNVVQGDGGKQQRAALPGTARQALRLRSAEVQAGA